MRGAQHHSHGNASAAQCGALSTDRDARLTRVSLTETACAANIASPPDILRGRELNPGLPRDGRKY